MTEKERLQNLFEWMALHDHDHLSDGAWMACMEEGVDSYNTLHGTDYDAEEMLIHYAEDQQQQDKEWTEEDEEGLQDFLEYINC